MDSVVARAMAKWPNVPAVYGWLSLDRRGNWRIKDERVTHAALREFIGRGQFVANDMGQLAHATVFMIGIVVSNTVLLTDFAENVRRADRVTPTEAIRRAAAIRVRPVVMTALATFFALVPMALGLARGSEANVPLGRAVLGGLLAGLVTTLFVVPCVYSLVVPDKFDEEEEPAAA